MRKGEAKAEYRGCKARACLNLDGQGLADVCSGSGFLDHMLASMTRTGLLDLEARADAGFYRIEALGKAIGQATGSGALRIAAEFGDTALHLFRWTRLLQM